MKTKRKQKVVGAQEYINSATGEIVPMQIVEVEERDYNFHKVWLEHFILATEEIRNVKLDLLFWILENINKENQLIMTQRVIAKQSGASLSTVRRTIKALMESHPPFLVKINSGAYKINPDIIWKGSHGARMGQVFIYNEEEH